MDDKVDDPVIKIKFVANQSDLEINGIQDDSFEWRKTKDLDFLFASRLVQDARDLRNFEYKKSELHLRYYEIFLRRELSWIMHFTILVNLSLAFIEKPIDLVSVPYWAPCLIELICLLIYSLRWLHLFSFQTPEFFWRDSKVWVKLFTIIVSIKFCK